MTGFATCGKVIRNVNRCTETVAPVSRVVCVAGLSVPHEESGRASAKEKP